LKRNFNLRIDGIGARHETERLKWRPLRAVLPLHDHVAVAPARRDHQGAFAAVARRDRAGDGFIEGDRELLEAVAVPARVEERAGGVHREDVHLSRRAAAGGRRASEAHRHLGFAGEHRGHSDLAEPFPRAAAISRVQQIALGTAREQLAGVSRGARGDGPVDRNGPFGGAREPGLQRARLAPRRAVTLEREQFSAGAAHEQRDAPLDDGRRRRRGDPVQNRNPAQTKPPARIFNMRAGVGAVSAERW
jgi:hypothetical protein